MSDEREVDAMLAAAWCEGRDAAAALCLATNEGRRHMSYDSRAHDPDDLAREIADIMPPASLASALTEHVQRAVEAERAAIAVWLDSRREVYEDRALRKAGKDDEADMMAAACYETASACYETASNFVRARSTP